MFVSFCRRWPVEAQAVLLSRSRAQSIQLITELLQQQREVLLICGSWKFPVDVNAIEQARRGDVAVQSLPTFPTTNILIQDETRAWRPASVLAAVEKACASAELAPPSEITVFKLG